MRPEFGTDDAPTAPEAAPVDGQTELPFLSDAGLTKLRDSAVLARTKAQRNMQHYDDEKHPWEVIDSGMEWVIRLVDENKRLHRLLAGEPE